MNLPTRSLAKPPRPAAPTGMAARLGVYVRLTRPAFLAITVAACALGLATAAASRVPVQWGLALLTLLLACVAHAAANVLNDVHDARSGADAANTEGLFPFTGGSRLIQRGEVTEAQAARLAWTLLALVVPAGLWLVAARGAGLAAIGLIGLLIAWAYSAPPLKLMARGLGEVGVGAAWCLVVVGADFVQRGNLAPAPWWLGAGLGLMVSNILLINGFPDARADASVGKRTLVVRAGPHAAARVYLCAALLAVALPLLAVSLGVVPAGALGAWLGLPASLAAWRVLAARATEPATLRPALALTIAAANLHALGGALGLAIGRWT